jgi:hypothetical protein
MALLTARSSTIFIATGLGTQVFRSVDQIPPALRRKLQETTRGLNSATILIADKRGRDELVRALQGQPSDVHCRLAETIRSRQTQAAPEHRRRLPFGSVRVWIEFLLPVAVAAMLWFLVESHF